MSDCVTQAGPKGGRSDLWTSNVCNITAESHFIWLNSHSINIVHTAAIRNVWWTDWGIW